MIFRKIASILFLLVAVLAAGATGYQLIEGWTFFDGLYMTVITVASVGYGETHPLSDNGRIFTIFLILSGSGILLYSISMITAIIVEGELTDVLKRMKMDKAIERLSGHYIVCGDSQTGRYAIEELRKTKRPFVVIETDKSKLSTLAERGILCIDGDATTDAVLQSAGVVRAKGLFSTLHTDAENLFVVLTAKGLNPELRIVSKAVDEESRQKLIKVGADRVIMPNAIGGLRMVSEMMRPSVVTFLDIMMRSKEKTIRVEEIVVPVGSPWIGKTLGESGVLQQSDVTVVALVLREGEAYLFNPPHDSPIVQGTVVITIGVVDAIDEVRARCAPHHAEPVTQPA
ncbi:MAG: potassium channel protein [Sulfuricella sp.]|nr:potassium channel protein [Sulfuricella sp.]